MNKPWCMVNRHKPGKQATWLAMQIQIEREWQGLVEKVESNLRERAETLRAKIASSNLSVQQQDELFDRLEEVLFDAEFMGITV
ncbi:MAG: hypothetical protein WCV84_06080 [Patescibacteria group bacterium]